MTLQVGTVAAPIPPGSIRKHPNGVFTFRGAVDGVSLNVIIKPTGTLRYAFQMHPTGANLTGTVNPVTVRLTIGEDSGTTSAKARFF